ncbi:GNAT family N-acetyltransferase [Actinocatenispora rupis]|uniref:N-acetyltransferase n=1 Tax=Actinocatenispora rupis TaxID=519421 RepID=A0A8J3NDS9_9ACTN|nr:GNAT family N-acetyltransferase [Actinocatenispora rupis]GID13250.1 N-acetyltransferase [Actinocatenispora rupis]
MAIETRVNPTVTADLVDEIAELWVRVTNAGGAVGFVPPVTVDDIRPTAERTLAAVAAGTDVLVALVEDGRVLAWCVLEEGSSGLRRHWRTVVRVQVDPERQGTGLGDRLMRAVGEVARDLGLAALHLAVRGGTGIEKFYRRHGYREVGRLPAAIRVGADDDRDEIIMWLPVA